MFVNHLCRVSRMHRYMAIGKSLKMSLESCMDVPELMKKLNKKPASQENEAKKEDETAGNLPLWTKAQQKGE